MGRTLRCGVYIAGLTMGLGIMAGSVSYAGTASPPDTSDTDTTDTTTTGDPDGDPENVDIDAFAAEFASVAADVTAANNVGDFSGGSTLTGPCGGLAKSFDQDGVLIDSAIDLGDGGPPIDVLDGGQAFTSSNPFKVDTSGTVTYYGFMPESDAGPLNHNWNINTFGVSIDSGGHPNTAGNNRNVGIVNLDEDLPIKFSAIVKISGQLNSENLEACVGEGYVEFIGDGLLSPLGLGGLAIFGGALLGLLFNARPAMTFKG